MYSEQELIEDLQRIEAIQIKTDEFFTWTSGMKSPIYCDNRLIMSDPEIRNKVADSFISLIEKTEHKPNCIAGCATAGIPHAAWVAAKLQLPMVYVRSSKKGHGKENQIEGRLMKGQKVIVIEDLISTGGSSINAAEAVREAGGEVIDILAIFTYGLPKAEQAFAQASFSYRALTNFDYLIEVLKKQGQLTEDREQILLDWRKSLNKL